MAVKRQLWVLKPSSIGGDGCYSYFVRAYKMQSVSGCFLQSKHAPWTDLLLTPRETIRFIQRNSKDLWADWECNHAVTSRSHFSHLLCVYLTAILRPQGAFSFLQLLRLSLSQAYPRILWLVPWLSNGIQSRSKTPSHSRPHSVTSVNQVSAPLTHTSLLKQWLSSHGEKKHSPSPSEVWPQGGLGPLVPRIIPVWVGEALPEQGPYL